VHPAGCRAGSSPAEAILVQPRADAYPWATDGSDASAGALRDAAADAHREPQHCLGEDAGKLADPVPDVLELDALLLPPARLAQPALAAPCTPDEVPCGERSCAVKELADAVAQLAPLALWPPEPMPVAVRQTGAAH
jgi:hypothetical protein